MLFSSRYWAAPAVALFSALISSQAAVPLGDALDATNLVWTTSGNPPWSGQTITTHDGVDAAESGAIADSVAASMNATVTGPGTLSFWWRVSSETNNDRLLFFINGVEQTRITGEVGWNLRSFSVPGGSQILTWTYSKNAALAAGLDRGWVDQVLFTPGCNYSLSTTNRSHGYGATTNTVGVLADASCSWVASKTNSWITILSGASGTGTGVVTYAITANSNLLAGRTGTVMIAGLPFTIQQSAQPCDYTLTPTTRTHGPAGGAGNSIGVTAAASCGWAVVNTSSWVTFTGATSGSGNGTLLYSVATNTTPVWRTNNITIGDQKFALLQRLASCLWELSPTNRVHGYGGSTGLVTVSLTAGGNCTWQVENTNSWIAITTAPNGIKSGSFGYVVDPNPTSSPRSGTFKVWDEVFTVLQQPTPCSYDIAPGSASVTAERTTNLVTLTAVAGCAWNTTNTNNWISIVPTNGIGSGPVSVIVNANSASLGRTGVVSIANQTFTVRQDSGACTYKLSTTNRTHGYSPATNSVTLTTLNVCPWVVVNTNSWITILSATSGSGTATISYGLPANGGINDRVGVVFIGGEALTITQRGLGCAISLTPTGRSHGYGSSSNAFSVTASLGCPWDVSNTNSWITIVGATNGSGNGVVGYLVAANPTGLSRPGYITVEDGAILITQSGAPCSYTLTPASRTHGPASTTNILTVGTIPGCPWVATSSVPWITFLSGPTGSGSNTITYAVDANTAPIDRTGTVTVDGQTCLIVQRAVSCTYSLSPDTRSHGAGATTNSFFVTAANGCSWSAMNTSSWVTISAASNAQGSGSVSYALGDNTSLSERIATITVEDQTFVITQRAATCDISLTPGMVNHGYGAVTNTVSISTGTGCAWNIQNSNYWITILSPLSGSGGGTMTYVVSSNGSFTARSGNVLVGGEIFAASQSGFQCSYKLSTANRTHGFGMTTNSVNVTNTAPGCAWSVINTNDWLSILSGASGNGNGTIVYAILPNYGTTPRTATVTVVDQVLTVQQLASTSGFVFESVIPGVSGGITLKLNGGPPGIWAIESSTNLNTWSKVADITNTTGRVEYNVPAGGPSRRFYRAKLQ